MAKQSEGRSRLVLYLVVGWKRLSFGFLNPEEGTDRVSRNVGKKFQLLAV